MSDIRIQKTGEPDILQTSGGKADSFRADPDQTPQRPQAGHLAER